MQAHALIAFCVICTFMLKMEKKKERRRKKSYYFVSSYITVFLSFLNFTNKYQIIAAILHLKFYITNLYCLASFSHVSCFPMHEWSTPEH